MAARIHRDINDWLVEQVDPQPGQTILDVAAGTGDLGFLAAERVGDDGKVLTTDFAPEMLEAARRNGERRGLPNVEYRVLDAERMDLDDDTVDGVLCRWGYMLMADPGRGARGDPPRPARRRHARLRGLADARPQPVGGDSRHGARPARTHAAARARRPGDLRDGRQRAGSRSW